MGTFFFGCVVMEIGETIYFKDRSAFRKWLEKNFDKKPCLWLGFFKKHLARGLTYNDAVEEALCFGWIDGILKRIDDKKHVIRFSPRRENSVWASSNIARVKKMIKEGKMTEAGEKKVPRGFKADY